VELCRDFIGKAVLDVDRGGDGVLG
jgi:hypothetical protein